MIRVFVRILFLAVLILLYVFVFAVLEEKKQENENVLEIALPVNFYKITAGYLKQLAAEMLFVKSSVFVGGIKPGIAPESYVGALGNNFDVMTGLYPYFVDPYYFCQAFLPSVSIEAASKANEILARGIIAHPDDLILRFFYGTNFFLEMNEPLKGAKVFMEAAKLPNAPPMFAHLAAVLSAEGGDITAGLISLKIMFETEKDEIVRKRYQQEIVVFEQALKVQSALSAYSNRYGNVPTTLERLVPEFLSALPEINNFFVLVYDPPNISLQRPERIKNK